MISVKKTTLDKIEINSPEWLSAEEYSVNENNWEKYKNNIKTTVRMLHNNDGIFVKFSSDEHPVVIETTEHDGDVYKDSAVELFLAPCETDENYFNFEINAKGCALIGFGPGRKRTRFNAKETDYSQFRIESEISDNGFEVSFFVPFSFLEQKCKVTKNMRGNMQKCRELGDIPHYNSAFKISTESPDFHRSEYFGKITLE